MRGCSAGVLLVRSIHNIIVTVDVIPAQLHTNIKSTTHLQKLLHKTYSTNVSQAIIIRHFFMSANHSQLLSSDSAE